MALSSNSDYNRSICSASSLNGGDQHGRIVTNHATIFTRHESCDIPTDREHYDGYKVGIYLVTDDGPTIKNTMVKVDDDIGPSLIYDLQAFRPGANSNYYQHKADVCNLASVEVVEEITLSMYLGALITSIASALVYT